MNGEISTIPITTLAGISSLTDLLPEMPLPTPHPHSLSNKSLLFHPRVAEEANNLLNLRDEILVPLLATSLAQTSSEHIELKDNYSFTDQLNDRQPELLKAILQRNPNVFKNPSVSQNWQVQRQTSQLSQQQHQKAGNFPQQVHQRFQIQSSPQTVLPQSIHSPQQSMLSPQTHSQQQQYQQMRQQQQLNMQSLQQGVASLPSFNNLSDFVNDPTMNPYHSPSSTNALVNSQNRLGGSGYIDSPYQQHNFNPSTTSHGLLSTDAGGSNTTTSISGNYVYPTNSNMPLPTPTPTPSPTPALETSFLNRASVIMSDDCQENGMFPVTSGAEKFLIGNDMNLNMSGPSLDTDIIAENLAQLPSILDTTINQPIQISSQLQSQIESHLQLNGQNHINSQLNPQEIFSADMLDSTIVSNLLGNDSIISGDLVMTPPPSSSVPSQIDSVQQGISPKNTSDLPLENDFMTNVSKNNNVFQKSKEIFKDPVIKLHRLTDLELQQNVSRKSNINLNDSNKMGSLENKNNSNLRNKDRGDENLSTFDKLGLKRKRNSRLPDLPVKDEDYVVKPKLRKIERKLVPVLEKLSIDELMETNTYQKFNRSIEKVFENVDDMDLALNVESDDDDIPEETLIQKYQLADLCSEAAKLKALGCMESIPIDRLIRLLGILEKNIRSGAKVSPLADENEDEYERKLWMETAMERISRAVDSSLIALYVLTSAGMNKKVYLEDVIDRIIMFAKFQLHNTIYPSYDPVYRSGHKKDNRKKQTKLRVVKDKSLINLYTKLVEVVSLLSELLNIQPLTDNSILHLSTMGVAPFFVEGISELQLNSLKLVTSIFMKYEKHRKLLLDDILASMGRLPSSKQSLRSYRVTSQDYIQILTALILQLFQCMVVLPKDVYAKRATWDPDNEISRKFKTASSTASNFLMVFLNKCSSKNEDTDFRPLFENFIQDLLTTVNKPEWPVSELLLSVLGKLLVTKFANKSVEMSLRVASLDYLGLIAARLRRDSVTSNLNVSTIDSIIKDIRKEEAKELDEKIKNLEINNEEERIEFLQRILLDYLAVKSHSDESLFYARHFYICQWYHDVLNEINAPVIKADKSQKSKKKHRRRDESSEESEESEEEEDDVKKTNANKSIINEKSENKKRFFLSKVNPFELRDSVAVRKKQMDVMHTYIDYDGAELVTRYLASKRPFSKSFETYLKHIIKVLMESSVLIRTKAMKCLTLIVESDPAVLGLKEMQVGVRHSFLDHSTSVREAAVDLVGKFVLSQPELIENYYTMLSDRILDTGVSVRKRVIKILKDICIEYPSYMRIPEICVKMIRRVNDEDGIRKLVMEVFQNMWFIPVRERETGEDSPLQQKVLNITDVVSACKGMGLDWFEQLLFSLFKPKEDKDDATKVVTEPPKILVTACKQIVDCLIDNVISLDGRGGNAPQRLVACVTTLYLFAKIRPKLLVEHAITLQPYLSLKCQTPGDYQIISCVAKILEIVVPMLEHASETFLAQLEEDSVKLIFQHDQTVILSCISCLGSVVNNVTHNYTLIRDCFLKYYKPLLKLKRNLENGGNASCLNQRSISVDLRRSMYIIGLMLRFFDFKNPELRGDKLSMDICDEVFTTLTYFMHVENQDSSLFALRSVGSMCIRHYDYMLGPELLAHYQGILRGETSQVPMKVQVLNNIKNYLQEEEKRMIKQDEDWAELSKKENLKEMGDVSSGMASTIIQLYLKDVLEAFLHMSSSVRQAALGVIQLILSQGLVHPVQIVPYLICMSTDEDKGISSCADKQLHDIEKKYPGFIHMKAQNGIKLSFKLQNIIQGVGETRGFRVKESELPSALNGFLYSILRGKQQRRALIMSILKQFEEHAFQNTTLSHLLYLADNVAYFPYQVMDEPLFIIHQINIMISVTGTNLLQSFKESLLPNPNDKGEQTNNQNIDDDEEEDEELLLRRVPEDTKTLQDCMLASQGCLMLLVLKQHLKTLYGFTDSKISLYSPSETAKVYEKALTRKNNSKFHPKGTLQKLKTLSDSTDGILNDEGKRALISEYIEFKQLIISLDKEEGDDDDDIVKLKPQPNKTNNTPVEGEYRIKAAVDDSTVITEGSAQLQPESAANLSYNSDTVISNHTIQQVPPLRVPKLTIVAPKLHNSESSRHSHSHSHSHRSHKSKKSDRHKKHHKKKKKYRSDDSDDDDMHSDPDFAA